MPNPTYWNGNPNGRTIPSYHHCMYKGLSPYQSLRLDIGFLEIINILVETLLGVIQKHIQRLGEDIDNVRWKKSKSKLPDTEPK